MAWAKIASAAALGINAIPITIGTDVTTGLADGLSLQAQSFVEPVSKLR